MTKTNTKERIELVHKDLELMAYSKLTEAEKIPYRIQMAEILALRDLDRGEDLTYELEYCIKHEQYCGAEGIRRALEKFRKNGNKV